MTSQSIAQPSSESIRDEDEKSIFDFSFSNQGNSQGFSGPGPGDPPDPDPVPLTGLEWLLIAGAGFGAKKMYDRKRKSDDSE